MSGEHDALLVAIARLETKVDGLRADRIDDREYLRSVSRRIGALEVRVARVLGWAAGVSAAVSVLVAMVKGVF